MNYETLRNNPEILDNFRSRSLINLECDGCHVSYDKPKNYIQGKLKLGATNNYCSAECLKSPKEQDYGTFNCTNCDLPQKRLLSQMVLNNFCGNSCAATHNNSQRIKLVKPYKPTMADKIYEKIMSGTASSATMKNYLLKTTGCVCSRCNLSTWCGLQIPIELEHIDGNSENNALQNCCLLCPNCHAQTPTYKAKNKGNGRHARRTRYQEGKSF